MSAFFRSDDPVRDFHRYDAYMEGLRKDLPRCDHCHKPIEEERYVVFDDFRVCPDCPEKHYTRDNEAYM